MTYITAFLCRVTFRVTFLNLDPIISFQNGVFTGFPETGVERIELHPYCHFSPYLRRF